MNVRMNTVLGLFLSSFCALSCWRTDASRMCWCWGGVGDPY